MISSLYDKYFQKSRSFLFPALGINKKNPFTPAGVYLSIKDKIGVEDMILVCAYKAEDTSVFKTFEKNVLQSNKLFEYVIEADGFKLYMFKFTEYKEDWKYFLEGKYSKLSKDMKSHIKDYFGPLSSEYLYMKTYLYPEKYMDVYAKLLNVKLSVLKEVGELCDKYDIEKETLSIDVK
jgi:hypothetical protein